MQGSNKAVKRNDLIYDVGMHKGEDTDYYLRKGFSVVAFEADPELVSIATKRFQKEIIEERLVIVEGAIVERKEGDAEKMESVVFYKSSNSVWGTVVGDWASRNESLGSSNLVIKVPAIDFVACLEKYGIPHYMKIDIEGMDRVCLKALRFFESKPDYISIESEKVKFSRLTEEFDLFNELGFDHFQVIDQQIVDRQVEPIHTAEGCYTETKFQYGASGLFGADLPGTWWKRQRAINYYKKIFLKYKLFGDYGLLNRSRIGRLILFRLNHILREPLPSWYDTHARHSSIKD